MTRPASNSSIARTKTATGGPFARSVASAFNKPVRVGPNYAAAIKSQLTAKQAETNRKYQTVINGILRGSGSGGNPYVQQKVTSTGKKKIT